MAIEQRFRLPDGQLLDAETITNLYLYAQETTPSGNELLSSDLIRPELDFSNVPENATNFSTIRPANTTVVNTLIDAEPYMDTGPGRFANGSQFDLVRAFFGLGKDEMLTENGRNFFDESVTLPPGRYTKRRINELLFDNRLGGFSSSLELRNYRDSLSATDADNNGVSEYAELVYVWNSTAFAISDDARFIVDENGDKRIENFVIQPNLFENPLSRENFDFATANPIVETGSELLLEPLVDPSGIGRQVFINFYNRQNVPEYDPDQFSSPGVYDESDFQQDLLIEADNFTPTSVGVIPQVRNQAFELFDEGVTDFRFDDKSIYYGSIEDDTLIGRVLVDADRDSIVLNPRDGDFNEGIVLLGGRGDDSIQGDAFIFGELTGGTDDILVGHEGDDSLDGGGGDDIAIFSGNSIEYDIDTQTTGGIFVERTITTITHRNDRVDGEDSLENIEFAQFKDGIVTLPFDPDNPIIPINFTGGSGRDNLFGNAFSNSISGGGGNDRLEGREGNDTLEGGFGFDTIKGEDDNDSLVGGGFRDTLIGGGGNDIIEGGEGHDSIFGGDGIDMIFGGEEDDTISGGNQRDLIVGDEGNDSLVGGNDSDSIFAKIGDDSLYGQNGDDTLYGNDGVDRLEGGSDNDILGGGSDNDLLFGQDGNDSLDGGGENDRLEGGIGNDTLTGGSGRDNFVFDQLRNETDIINDFSPADDTMLFRAAGFAGISTTGMLDSRMLTIGRSATSAFHRFIYNPGSGDLFYDLDGSGRRPQFLIAELDPGLPLTNADFNIY